ncbi:cytochrome-c peroxidase [Mariniflexile gromovii]|uniref:Methylamine utilization protein n=1 Tax=Mariniflexile gromovii TaxID=362523 RepID=A0ABS4BVI1_9FLAO|nr:cytochrome c peroxidase [Mariniflexile gromovii]MBP0904591.1 methylamine utilization protein [Mariniflexile gromovii]
MIYLKEKGAYVFISLFLSLLVCGCNSESKKTQPIENEFQILEKNYLNSLNTIKTQLDSMAMSSNKNDIESLYLKARKEFKWIEPILAFVDSENYKFLNQPNILKIEEEDLTDVKILDPTGFQVLEEHIFSDDFNIQTVTKHAKLTSNRINFIKNNTNFNFLKNHHILWMLRDQIIRTSLTGITGFDSPTENSLEEAQYSYKSLIAILELFKNQFSDESLLSEWKTELNTSISNLKSDFVSFNRYHFTKTHTTNALSLWKQTVTDWKITFPFKKAINYETASLFSDKTFNMNYFSNEKVDSISQEKVELGEMLFYEKALSKNNSISCATCHQAEKYFTDGKKISTGVTRNSPTLLYAALQQSFFYDNRAGSLEGQIVEVVNNANEFHTDLKHLETTVKSNKTYTNAFSKLYNEGITQDNVRNAIATYIRSLTPFNSKFDKNMNGLENTLTTSEINGYNIFNGKGKCATCHFPPLFNGTVPVAYKESEMELIGVPKTNDTIHAEINDDLGRYMVFKTTQRKHFFKTPTVRNIEKTAPYMHNGVFNTLEEVIDFYNRGGGNGLGFNLELQTLPEDKLNLSKQEVTDLIAFMKTLTDSIY